MVDAAVGRNSENCRDLHYDLEQTGLKGPHQEHWSLPDTSAQSALTGSRDFWPRTSGQLWLQGRQEAADLCEFEASLVCIMKKSTWS